MRQGTSLALAVVALLLALSGPLSVGQAAHENQGDQGLQGGWAVDNSGHVDFVQGPASQFPLMQSAGAGWVRINFRLGECFSDWTSMGCNGQTALQVYDEVVTLAESHNLQVLGLLSNESWRGTQTQWTASNAETTGGNGDNLYLRDFAQKAAGTLADYFAERITEWEIWNEPNAWTTRDNRGNPTGGTYIYPSNFAWLLRRSYEAIKAVQPRATVISGGLFAHDGGGVAVTIAENSETKRVTKRGELGAVGTARADNPTPQPACSSTLVSGAGYLCATYEMGVQKAGWKAGAYPLDQIGQHLYLDQDRTTSGTKLTAYLQDLHSAYVAYEGSTTDKQIHVTEVGWTTASVSLTVQADNLRTAYNTFRDTSYVGRAYWFSVQDVPVAALFYGIVNTEKQPKPAFTAYQESAVYEADRTSRTSPGRAALAEGVIGLDPSVGR